MTERDQLYRGLGHDISKCHAVNQILRSAQLDWRVHSVPVEALPPGSKARLRSRSWKAIIREDQETEGGYRWFDTATSGYVVTQNEEILQVFWDIANLGQMSMEVAGSINNGERIFAVARLDGEFFFPGVSDKARIDHGVGPNDMDDRTYLKILMGAAHMKGLANTIDVIAERQICTNGARISSSAQRWRFVHRRRLTESDKEEVGNFVQIARSAFETYKQAATLLHDTKFTDEVATMYMVELEQPELLKPAIDHVQNKSKRLDPKSKEFGSRLVDHVVSKQSIYLQREKFNRSLKTLLSCIPQQPGYEMAPGTAWITYNAVTWFVDHRKGRTQDIGVESAFYGVGAKKKIAALELAKDYCERLSV